MIDKQLRLNASTGQAITDSALSTYSVDLSAVRDIGKGTQLYVIICIKTSCAGADATKNLNIDVRTSAGEALGSATVLLTTRAYTGAVLKAGRAPIVIPIPMGVAQQYIGVYYTVDYTFTSFLVDAYIGTEYQSNI